MNDLKHKLDIANRLLETYHIEPITEADLERTRKKLNTSPCAEKTRQLFNDFCREREAIRINYAIDR